MANSRIKGITVEIGGDTTGLQKALESVSKQIKNTQSQLKDVEKLLKMDPGNTELLTQKQKLLNDSISETKEKLETLKTAANQANDALSKGDISKDQYDALQREIIETENQLKSLEEQASKSATAIQKIALAGDKLKSTGDSISDVGKKLAPLSAAASAIGVAGVSAATDWESAFTGVKKTVDATEKEYEALADGIQEMASQTASSMEDIAGVMEVAGQLGINKDYLLEFTKVMVELGDTTNISASDAATSLARFINITGDSVQNIEKLGSAIVDLGNNFATDEASIVEMSTRLASAGTLAGLSSTDILALSTAMSSVGIQAEAGGTAMTQTLTAIESAVASFSTGSTEDLEAIGKVANMSAVEFSNTWKNEPIKAIEAFISGLGGLDEKGESATLVLDNLGMSGIRQANMLKSLALASDVLTDAVQTSNTAYIQNSALTEEANKRYQTFESKLSQFKETLKTVAIDIGQTLIPILQDLMDKLKGVVTWWSSLSDGSRKLIVDIGLIIAALSPVLIVVGKLISAVGSIMSIIPKLAPLLNTVKGAFTALNAVMAANPIILVIAAIAALVAAFVYLWNNCEEFRNFWIELWEKIKETVTTVITNISTFISESWNNIKTTISTILSSIATNISLIFNNISNGIKNTINSIVTTIKSGFNSAVSFIKGLISSAYSWGADLISNIISGIKSKIEKVKEAVSGVASTIKSYLHFSVPDEGPLTDFESWMPDFMKGLADGINSSRDIVDKAINSLSSALVITPQVNNAEAMNSSVKESIVEHTGTIRVEGVNDNNTLTGVVDIIIDQLRQEVRV